jgi:hypothetical protein
MTRAQHHKPFAHLMNNIPTMHGGTIVRSSSVRCQLYICGLPTRALWAFYHNIDIFLDKEVGHSALPEFPVSQAKKRHRVLTVGWNKAEATVSSLPMNTESDLYKEFRNLAANHTTQQSWLCLNNHATVQSEKKSSTILRPSKIALGGSFGVSSKFVLGGLG